MAGRRLRVLAAQEQAGKTWAALDLAVSVACGRPWLDHFACPTAGPVLVFLGEGGERATVRRVEAIATAKGIDPDQLADRLRLCFRASRLAAPGAGPAAWAQVICSVAVHYRGSDPDGPATSCSGSS